ncbi:MAG: PhzF family phenazine biosynthesis protein [Gammaproteobacteria bacterium]|nr:PhzF family phenazine biosynthesis protein [Gammaproteobacteria bacterium]
MKLRYYTLDVFTDQIFGGNQLAVFPEAGVLTDRQMQLIAGELNLSETVFVTESKNPECINRLRIFTPRCELPFAGHPTVGAAFLLAKIGAIYLESGDTRVVFEEGVGQVPVEIRSRNGQPGYTQLTTAVRPQLGNDVPGREIVASMLSLAVGDIVSDEHAIQTASCGVPYLLVELNSLADVARAKLNYLVWKQYLQQTEAAAIYLYAREAILPSSHLHARCFAPGLGIFEDAATGSAASALAGALAMRSSKSDAEFRWIVEQGFELKRPSFLEVQAVKRNGNVMTVKVGGSSVIVAEGLMTVPE